jgi:serine/threonine protein kinase
MQEDLTPPATGLVAGKYQIIRLIGRGGMGSVWEGRHNSLGTSVAIKFIDAEYAESAEARSRFDNEARAAATIQSKYAIQIFDHGISEDGRPYIVMEMLVGEPLDRRIERVGRITPVETARILKQVSRALQRAHDAGVIHRDLKPENIFLVRSPDDDDEIAKVLDFGIAKIQPPPGQQGVSSSTKTGAVLGTPYFMSPEQARGLRNVDHRTDLWSLGVIAYKCVVGVLPFEGESVGDLLVKICTAPLAIPSQAVPGLPPAFDAWFAHALERDPAGRFQSATELADALAFAVGLSSYRGAPSGPGFYAGPSSVARPMTGAMSSYPSNATPASPSNPSHPSYPMTPRPPYSNPSAGMTNSPLINSSPRPVRSSRGVMIASLGAALLGLSVGALAIVRFVDHPSSGVAASVQPPPPASSSAAIAPPPPPVASLDPLVPPPPETHPPAQGMHPGLAVTTKPGTKPSAAPPPITPATITAPTYTGAPPPTTPPPPPHPTSKPNTADPGY